ncbi:MAG: biotin synthase BioB [Candidatus Melainabacteria bacterium]|nr:MAG: biotin synthase BioB [Candidatus Melainabacteria bacterium]
MAVRNDWQVDEVSKIYHTRLLNLIYQAASVHHQFHKPEDIQQCTLLSIKTGACPEDCAYCPQSSRYKTNVKPEPLLSIESVIDSARTAREAGSTRFCMGAAWREVKDDEAFEQVLAMVEGVSSLGLEVCCTLGMLTLAQASRLKKAGVYAYNHNLDTGAGYYGEIITTRRYQERLDTLKNVRQVGMTVCCGGIIGMGESHSDRIDLLHTLATLEEHPESVPINALVAVEGTPLADQPPVSPFELIRMIAAARILMPRAKVRLSAGRAALSIAEQALCFLAGANSIFTGDKLLTTPNCDFDEDRNMLELLGLEAESNAFLAAVDKR